MAKANTQSTIAAAAAPPRMPGTATNWREALPTLVRPGLVLREPVVADALALLTALPDAAMSLVVPDPPPATVTGLETFIAGLQADRRSGALACWAIVPEDSQMPVGLIGVRALDSQAAMVEGFAVVAEEFRGTSLFQSAARMLLGGLFDAMRVHRVEFRIDVRNGRANGALRKLGASQEGLLRRARCAGGEFHDQVLWAIVATDWADLRSQRTASVH